ncbi:MAG: adenylate kinase [Capsulimonas sp.]
MRRISIVGTTGSGKSTLARKLGRTLHIPVTELDALHWEPNWTESSPEQLSTRVARIVTGECWVLEGGYSRVRPQIWTRADTVIWLDYSFPVNFTRLVKRTARRIVFREVLWSGNRESLARTFSRDSILIWLFKTHRAGRSKFVTQLAQPEYAHLNVHHFRSPRQTDAWLRALSNSIN